MHGAVPSPPLPLSPLSSPTTPLPPPCPLATTTSPHTHFCQAPNEASLCFTEDFGHWQQLGCSVVTTTKSFQEAFDDDETLTYNPEYTAAIILSKCMAAKGMGIGTGMCKLEHRECKGVRMSTRVYVEALRVYVRACLCTPLMLT